MSTVPTSVPTKKEVTINTTTLDSLPSQITSFLANIIRSCHTEAAFLMGILTVFGVVPSPAGKSVGTGLLLGYAAITHTATQLSKNV